MLAKAHISARLSLTERGNAFPNLEAMLNFTPDGLKSAPL